ncbi:MAG: hypothetical protein GYB67_10095 [Chloroflexi bacterium]|nr:hypothetical protein [Chloroflexota bacterium]
MSDMSDMPMETPDAPARCQVIVGVIVRRRHNRIAVGQCSYCGLPACEEHLPQTHDGNRCALCDGQVANAEHPEGPYMRYEESSSAAAGDDSSTTAAYFDEQDEDTFADLS